MNHTERRRAKRWQRYLADEIAEAALYHRLAQKSSGVEREIFSQLAEAETRHAAHWAELLGADTRLPRPTLRTRLLAWAASRFGSVFVLALAQRAEESTPYRRENDATRAMAADEMVHSEVVRALAAHSRRRLSGNVRAAIFGANDGLVSNLALVLGIGATGVSNQVVLFSGLAGLMAGSLSMAAGEYVSVSSQRQLLAASRPARQTIEVLADLDAQANELALVYRARGASAADARRDARAVLSRITGRSDAGLETELGLDGIGDEHEAVGNARAAAISSFCFFATGALIPVLPWIFGLAGFPAILIALGLVGLTLLVTGAFVGVLSGSSPGRRALGQLAVGFGAAGVTYLLGLWLGVLVS